jgi:hypothetical protein
VEKPTLNDRGTVAFYRSAFDATGQFVSAIVTGSGGPLTTVADTTGPFGSFGFRPPSLDNNGSVAFLATLDDQVTTGIFVGPRVVQDRVIETGDKLDGGTVAGLLFCEEGLNDLGQLSFIATIADPAAPNGSRTAVFIATPKK